MAVPFAAAGVIDIVARVVFDRIALTTNQTIVIDNRPGAGGTIAIDQVGRRCSPISATLMRTKVTPNRRRARDWRWSGPWPPFRPKSVSTFMSAGPGTVVVGDLIGEHTAQDEAVVGETPNLAARLQAHGEPDTVIIAGITRSLLGDLFEYRALGAGPFSFGWIRPSVRALRWGVNQRPRWCRAGLFYFCGPYMSSSAASAVRM